MGGRWTGASCAVFVCPFCSFIFTLEPSFAILSVYPVNGTKGEVYVVVGTWSVLPKTPEITGIWALSPSRKNPNTISPGLILWFVAIFEAPLPSVVERRIWAHGSSSFGSSPSS